MSLLALKQVAENREVGVDGIEQPEIRNIGRSEVRQALILLPAGTGKLCATGGENLDQSAQHSGQVLTSADLKQRRNKPRVQKKCVRLGTLHIGDTQNRTAFAILVFSQQPQILPRNLDRLLAYTSILVAESCNFSEITAAAVLLRNSDIEPALPVLGDGQVNIQALRAGFKEIRQRLGGWRRVRVRDIEQQPIRENTRSPRDYKLPFSEHLLINDEFTESPGAELQRLQAEIKRVLDKPVLRLQVLGSEERPLGPDHRLQLLHKIPTGAHDNNFGDEKQTAAAGHLLGLGTTTTLAQTY